MLLVTYLKSSFVERGLRASWAVEMVIRFFLSFILRCRIRTTLLRTICALVNLRECFLQNLDTSLNILVDFLMFFKCCSRLGSKCNLVSYSSISNSASGKNVFTNFVEPNVI